MDGGRRPRARSGAMSGASRCHLREEPRKLSHVLEHAGPRALEPVARRQPARIAERPHTGGAGRLDATPAVFDDHAVFGGDGHSLRRVKEEIRRWLAVGDLAGAEDATGEAVV